MKQMMQVRLLTAGFLGLSLFGCDVANEPLLSASKQSEKASDAAKKVVDPQFKDVTLAAAGEYRNWSLVDDAWRWAPALCDAPPSGHSTRDPRPSQLRTSESSDTISHGRKMYRVFAKDAPAYAKLSKGIAASPLAPSGDSVPPAALKDVTQVIVKESWIPQHAAANDANSPAPQSNPLKQSALFMMLKMGDEKESGTDEGWIYATVTPDTKEVTGAGRMETCMKCHADAPHGRLFGLKPASGKS